MSNFPPYTVVSIFQDKPKSLDAFMAAKLEADLPAYRLYLERFQAWRWRATDGHSHEILAQGESYFNREDCDATVRRLFDNNTNVYLQRREGDDWPVGTTFGQELLRRGQ